MMMDMVKVARDQNNVALNVALGSEKNWFGIVLGLATKRAKGKDALDIATEACEEIILAMYNPDDKFRQGVDELISKGKESEVVAYFTNAAAIRVRRLAGRFQRKMDRVAKHFSALECHRGKSEEGNSYDVPEREQVSSDFTIGEMIASVVEELGRMSADANDSRTQRRLLKAQEVAVKRLENPPDYVPLDELLTLFPDVKKTAMHVILGDIQEAWNTVCEREEIPVRKIA